MLFKVARDVRPSAGPDAVAFKALVASLYGWVSALLPGLRPRQVATCLYAIGRLELFNEELVAGLAARAAQLMGNFQGWEYSNMVWALSRMNYSPGEHWLQQFVYWTEKRLGSFKPVELANTAGALARLGATPGSAWFDSFTSAVANQALEFNSLEAVNTLFGLASLGYTGGSEPGRWLEPLVTGRAPAGQGGQSGGGGGGGLAVESLRVSELTRAAWALTQFDWRPPERWLAAAMAAFIAQLRYCLPSDLATLSYSLAYLRATPTPDGLKLLAAALPRAWDRLTGDELANVAMSLALWQYRPQGDRWLDELALACRDKLPSCSPDGLAKVVSSLPLLGQDYRLGRVVAQAQGLLDGQAGRAGEADGVSNT
ncbi:hypothetical protein HYH03_015077 [Edaphochlamys debaryana]|uniref:Uncharacterized protein n=1 Tax=Edaphochlamys debaryana TaxID=47281 RepID=A0A836BSY3_9CHLO|nr:hypothetical protein HYH03_015077 [Edaphochlamys debaryana]|eukprot:KAG2486253.1 hypothetical protein HYH03_015077 [Edaphochlamys debaryana]